MADSNELVIDLSNYKERQGSRVAPGPYNVVVEDAETAVARTGSNMVNLWLKIEGGEYDGLTLTDRLVLTEKSMFRVVGFMQAIGLPTPKQKFKINLRQFIGKRLTVAVEDGEPYNGRVRSEVRGYERRAGAPATAAAESEDDFAGINSSFDTTSTSSDVDDLPDAGAAAAQHPDTAEAQPSQEGSLPAPETQPGTEAAATGDVSNADKKPSPAAKADDGSDDGIDLDGFDL